MILGACDTATGCTATATFLTSGTDTLGIVFSVGGGVTVTGVSTLVFFN